METQLLNTSEEQDPDYAAMIVSALRYALPRHSYMPGVTRAYISRNWDKLRGMRWCILRDTREHIERCMAYLDSESVSNSMDLKEWVDWYNQLLDRVDLDKINEALGRKITKIVM